MNQDAQSSSAAYPATTYHTTNVGGVSIFHREAGSPDRPKVLLLHGFPSSSHMYRELIPVLAQDYHVIAPDYPGFGHSSAPDTEQFSYTFDHIVEIMEAWLIAIGCTRFVLGMHDYGGPIGFRLAVRHPDWVTALLIQNANAYMEGINMEIFQPLVPFWSQRSPESDAPVRGMLTAETTRFQYTHGVRDMPRVSPDNWLHDQTLLDRPGNDQIHLSLLHDYQNNPPQYPTWQAYLRNHQPPTLITWGRNDPFFTEAGARAYLRDVPNAEFHLFDTGHFVLAEDGPRVAARMRTFIARQVYPALV